MGFGRSNKRSGPAAAPPPRAPPAPAPARQFGAPPMAQQPAQGPSMMGTFGSSMAGSMAGSMLGNAMFGGRGGEAAPQAVAPPPPAYGGQPAMPSPPVCTLETHTFLQCMTQSGENMEQCKHLYDSFKMCQAQAAYQMQQQPMQ